MAVHGKVVLRLRICRNSGCLSMFWICSCCDRGQRYCSAECRLYVHDPGPRRVGCPLGQSRCSARIGDMPMCLRLWWSMAMSQIFSPYESPQRHVADDANTACVQTRLRRLTVLALCRIAECNRIFPRMWRTRRTPREKRERHPREARHGGRIRNGE